MLTLFILGAFGFKAALIIYLIYRFAKWVNGKGDAIKQGYEDRIAAEQKENRRLRKKLTKKMARSGNHLSLVSSSSWGKGDS